MIVKSIRLSANLKSITFNLLENLSDEKLMKSLSASKNIQYLTISRINKEAVNKNVLSFISSNLHELKYLDFTCYNK